METPANTRDLLNQIDETAKASPGPKSPAPISPHRSPLAEEDAPPVPYAGKFDPKAIAKKATGNFTGVAKLGTDVALPDNIKASATTNSSNAGLKADKTVASASATSGKPLAVLIISFTT